jgi:hypothetical protein
VTAPSLGDALTVDMRRIAVTDDIVLANDNITHMSANADIINQLSYYMFNEVRMSAGFVRDVIEHIEALEKRANEWQATAAGLSQDISNAEDEIEQLREKLALKIQ